MSLNYLIFWLAFNSERRLSFRNPEGMRWRAFGVICELIGFVNYVNWSFGVFDAFMFSFSYSNIFQLRVVY